VPLVRRRRRADSGGVMGQSLAACTGDLLEQADNYGTPILCSIQDGWLFPAQVMIGVLLWAAGIVIGLYAMQLVKWYRRPMEASRR